VRKTPVYDAFFAEALADIAGFHRGRDRHSAHQRLLPRLMCCAVPPTAGIARIVIPGLASRCALCRFQWTDRAGASRARLGARRGAVQRNPQNAHQLSGQGGTCRGMCAIARAALHVGVSPPSFVAIWGFGASGTRRPWDSAPPGTQRPPRLGAPETQRPRDSTRAEIPNARGQHLNREAVGGDAGATGHGDCAYHAEDSDERAAGQGELFHATAFANLDN